MTQSRASAKDLQDSEARLGLQSWSQCLDAEGYAASSPALQGALKRLVEGQAALRAAALEVSAMEAEAAAGRAGADALYVSFCLALGSERP